MYGTFCAEEAIYQCWKIPVAKEFLSSYSEHRRKTGYRLRGRQTEQIFFGDHFFTVVCLPSFVTKQIEDLYLFGRLTYEVGLKSAQF